MLIEKGAQMMSVENIIESWREVRSGLIDEANQIPADQFSQSVRRITSIIWNRRLVAAVLRQTGTLNTN
jgi:hypothetical protein